MLHLKALTNSPFDFSARNELRRVREGDDSAAGGRSDPLVRGLVGVDAFLGVVALRDVLVVQVSGQDGQGRRHARGK